MPQIPLLVSLEQRYARHEGIPSISVEIVPLLRMVREYSAKQMRGILKMQLSANRPCRTTAAPLKRLWPRSLAAMTSSSVAFRGNPVSFSPTEPWAVIYSKACCRLCCLGCGV